MLSPEDHKRIRIQGRSVALQHLISRTPDNGDALAASESHATGMLEGVRDFLAAYVTPHAAYHALQSVADATGAELPKIDVEVRS